MKRKTSLRPGMSSRDSHPTIRPSDGVWTKSKKASDGWFEGAARRKSLSSRPGKQRKRQFEASGAGKTSMDSLRAFAKEMIEAESSLLSARAAAAASAHSSIYLTSRPAGSE